MATAWLEPICSILRVGATGSKHLDKYHVSATVRYLSIDEVEVCGFADPNLRCADCGEYVPDEDRPDAISKADWVAILKAFREAGVKRVLFWRMNCDPPREVRVNVNGTT